MKKGVLLFLCITLSLSLCGCIGTYDNTSFETGLNFGYSTVRNDAFALDYYWDGTPETQTIVIPDEYEGMPLTAIGGGIGLRGAPCHFNVDFNEQAKQKLCSKATNWDYDSGISCSPFTESQTFTFHIQIGKNLQSIYALSLCNTIVGSYEEDGQIHYFMAVLNYYITCDEGNETFYSHNGKLFYRADNTLAADIPYAEADTENNVYL